MSAKQLKAIAMGLAVLLLLWGASELFSRGSDTVTAKFTLPALTQGDVDTIALVKGTDSIVLAKQSSTAWTADGHRAAPDAVSDLFQALHDSVKPELVAEDSSSFGRMGVDSASGRWLRISNAGKPLLRLIVGARGSEYSSAYVRRPADSRVYLWRGRLAGLLDRAADEWRDKRIAAVSLDSVQAIEVERGKDRYTLRRRDKAWALEGPTTATDSGAVARLLERYRAITAAGFASPKQADSTRTPQPRRRVALRGAGGALLVALSFDSTSGAYVVRRTGGTATGGEPAAVYRMNTWDVDGLTPARSTLVATKQEKKK